MCVLHGNRESHRQCVCSRLQCVVEIGPRLLNTHHICYVMPRRSRNSDGLGSSDSTDSTQSRSSKKKKLIKKASNEIDDHERRIVHQDEEDSQSSISSKPNGKTPPVSVVTSRELSIGERSSGTPTNTIGANIFSKLNAGKGALSSSAKR
jgi:hypothetical protein